MKDTYLKNRVKNLMKSQDENLVLSKNQLLKIRKLDDFDLIMLFSETNDHGWLEAERILNLMSDK